MHKLSEPQCRIIGIQQGQNIWGEGAKEPESEQARGQTGKRAKKPETLTFIDFFTLSTSVTTRRHTAKIAKCRCHLDIRRFFSPQRWLIGGIVCSKVS